MSNLSGLNIIEFASSTLSSSSKGQLKATTCMHSTTFIVFRVTTRLCGIITICKLHIWANLVDSNALESSKVYVSYPNNLTRPYTTKPSKSYDQNVLVNKYLTLIERVLICNDISLLGLWPSLSTYSCVDPYTRTCVGLSPPLDQARKLSLLLLFHDGREESIVKRLLKPLLGHNLHRS